MEKLNSIDCEVGLVVPEMDHGAESSKWQSPGVLSLRVRLESEDWPLITLVAIGPDGEILVKPKRVVNRNRLPLSNESNQLSSSERPLNARTEESISKKVVTKGSLLL